MVPMVMPDTGLLDEPTRPAMYADTELNRKPATIMMIVIGNGHGEVLHDGVIEPGQRQGEHHQADQHGFHRQVSFRFRHDLSTRRRVPPRDRCGRRTSSDLRSEISVQMPPINIAPTPR